MYKRQSLQEWEESGRKRWEVSALIDLSVSRPDGINETLSLCVMLEGCDDATKAAAKAVLEPLATASKKAGAETLFLFTPKADRLTDNIRELTKLGKPTATPTMVLLDFPDKGGYYVSSATEVTAETVTGFLEAYKAKTLERKQLE